MKRLINETDFWRVVEFIDWKNNQDYNSHKYNLSFYFSDEDLELLRNTSKFYQSVLSIRCNNIKLGLGDDSYWDLKAHIVGLGREVFESVVKNPKLILDYIDRRKENFDYCFHPYENLVITETDNPIPCTNEND